MTFIALIVWVQHKHNIFHYHKHCKNMQSMQTQSYDICVNIDFGKFVGTKLKLCLRYTK